MHCPSVAIMSKRSRTTTCTIRTLPIKAHFGGAPKEPIDLVLFRKNELRNRLQNPHLTAAVRLFFSRQFTVETFPYMEALKAWRAAAAKRGRYTGTGDK